MVNGIDVELLLTALLNESFISCIADVVFSTSARRNVNLDRILAIIHFTQLEERF